MWRTLSFFEGHIKSKEEFRYQAREGFVVIEKNNRITIERSAQEPLVLTMPSISEMGTKKRVRYVADSAIVWLFMFMAGAPFTSQRSRMPKRLACSGAWRCGECGPGGACSGAALSGQSPLPVQHP